MASAAARNLRAKKAAATRHHPDKPERIAQLGQELKAAKAADYIQRVVDGAPPLTADQRNQLAVLLLRGGS